ncbi:hypothetical protein DL990_30325 [Amycolatopsis sp. WAC 01416]|uniref:hypothetical protein n=1 Tax=unclassified Amycolatopsis TaxID=2618356 RepID=UPI000F76A9E0|nr:MULTISPECIES: hypothetical protein [unclassified Amycolatopsis]RSN27477.1 hypothetical protein DL990_30325 [Amycolatopsis sp. WAC 01416]
MRELAIGLAASAALFAVPTSANAVAADPAPSRPGAGIAAECYPYPLLCGVIRNLSSSDRGLRITKAWGDRHDSSSWTTLAPGKSSRDSHVRDADGYWVARGCIAEQGWYEYKGPQWVKVSNVPLGSEWQVEYRC